jgi:hypothetical protein
MELGILKKKLGSYRSREGKLRKVPGELLIGVLRAWEAFTGPMSAFSVEVGLRPSQLGPLIHRARVYARNTVQGTEDFTEVQVADSGSLPSSDSVIELIWDNGKVIRFRRADELVDFLRKVA